MAAVERGEREAEETGRGHGSEEREMRPEKEGLRVNLSFTIEARATCGLCEMRSNMEFDNL